MDTRHAETEGSPLTIDALHQFAYCPRRMHLMHVQGLWADNAFTEEGRNIHQRVDGEEDQLPVPTPGIAAERPVTSRSVSLSSIALGLSGKLDLVESSGADAIPVEYKRGQVPDNPERSWEPERVQLMAQGMLLREAGYRCARGVLYFEASRTRVEIALDEALEARTLLLLSQAQALVQCPEPPLPLDGSRKCQGCSLAGICLPDETLALRGMMPNGGDRLPTGDSDAPSFSTHVFPRPGQEITPCSCQDEGIRRLYPPRDDAQPLYVQEQGATLGKTGENLKVTKGKETLLEAHLIDVSQVVLCGSVQVTAAALHLCAERGIPIVHLSMGHWFYGVTAGLGLRNAYDRAAQFRRAADPAFCLGLAKAFVWAKGQNQRTLLRRNGRDVPNITLDDMASALKNVQEANNLQELLGIEGTIARHYFGAFPSMLRPRETMEFTFDMAGRNRRPPKDPVNACLSFTYALLAKECTVALLANGLEPHWGFFHQPRHGRPALSLDLMEEFRAVVADSAVLSAINTGMVGKSSFETNGVAWSLNAAGRKAIIKAFELRMDQLITHPIFDYRISWRRTLMLQAQILVRVLRGEIPSYTGIVTR